MRLDRLRALPEAHQLLSVLDVHGLLAKSSDAVPKIEALDDESLLAELGVGRTSEDDISVLRHVSSREERRSSEEIANRAPCKDFERFKSLFEHVDQDVKAGLRQTRPFGKDASISTGNFFILGGQFVYVAETGERFRTPNG